MSCVSPSETNPIRVDILPVEATLFPGTIGLTFAPGKVDPGRWQRSLDVDLARLRDVYGTQVLVPPGRSCTGFRP